METNSSTNRWRGTRSQSAEWKNVSGAAAGFGATIYRNWDMIRPVGAGIIGGVTGGLAGGPAGAASGAMAANATAI